MGSSFFIHKTVLGASIAANVLIDLTNESRLAVNESTLVRNTKLDQAAQMKGQDMVTEGYFAHESPKGLSPWHWFKQVGYTFLYAGENLAVNFTDSVDIQNAWLASPLHRENILNVKFREIGIATVAGVYKNNPTIFIVQMFGTPATPKVSTATAQATSTKEKVQPDAKVLGALATAEGEVKGGAIQPGVLYPIITTRELAVVGNLEPIESVSVEAATPNYSTWYDRLLVDSSYYIDLFYRGLIILIALALVTMIVVEVRKQHYKHIMYGVLMLAVLAVFVFINQGLF